MIKGDYLNLTKGQLKSRDGIDLYSRKDFDGMHAAGCVAAGILDEIVTSVFPGQTTGKIDAIIALGCIIRGETSHYDLICNEVTRAILDISLIFDIPILHGILTTENLEQAKERSGDGMNNKGYECALSAVQMGIISS